MAGTALQGIAGLEWRLNGGRSLRYDEVPLVMGVVNVTPDSFSDGGLNFDRAKAVEFALELVADGASIIDIGGESTRPGADRVDSAEELDRVLPVIEGIRKSSDVAISVDTMKSSVARAALGAGADIINDVTALRHDPELANVVADNGTPVILMHMRGEPRTMQQDIRFTDVMGEVGSELSDLRDQAIRAGIAPASILVDPGIGFGKTFDQNVEILARAGEFRRIAPLVIGASRKAFIGHLTGRSDPRERVGGSLAAVAAAYAAGAVVVRVHDVKETVDLLKVLHAVKARQP